MAKGYGHFGPSGGVLSNGFRVEPGGSIGALRTAGIGGRIARHPPLDFSFVSQRAGSDQLSCLSGERADGRYRRNLVTAGSSGEGPFTIRFAYLRNRALPIDGLLSSPTPGQSLARRHVQLGPDRLRDAITRERAKDVVDRRARRKAVAWQRAPAAPGAQQIENVVIAARMSVLRDRPPGDASRIASRAEPAFLRSLG